MGAVQRFDAHLEHLAPDSVARLSPSASCEVLYHLLDHTPLGHPHSAPGPAAPSRPRLTPLWRWCTVESKGLNISGQGLGCWAHSKAQGRAAS